MTKQVFSLAMPERTASTAQLTRNVLEVCKIYLQLFGGETPQIVMFVEKSARHGWERIRRSPNHHGPTCMGVSSTNILSPKVERKSQWIQSTKVKVSERSEV